MGSEYINNFDFNNRSYRVYAQADQQFRRTAADIRQADAHYGKAQVLFGVSVRVPRGRVVSLIGGNGAGKSTTLNLVMGRHMVNISRMRLVKLDKEIRWP